VKKENDYFQVFHIDGTRPGDIHRGEIAVDVANYFSDHLSELHSPTIAIRTLTDMQAAVLKYSELKFAHKNSWDWDRSEKWAPGECGIWLSTYLALKKFVATSSSETKTILLMEDDIWFDKESTDFLDLLTTALGQLPTGWDYLTLYVPEPNREKYEESFHIGEIDVCKNYSEYSAVAILYSLSGAKKIIDNCEIEVTDPADVTILHDKKLHGYCILPGRHRAVSIFSYLNETQNSTIQGDVERYSVEAFVLS